MTEFADPQPGKGGVLHKAGWWLQALVLRLLWLAVGWMPPERISATGWRMMAWFGPRSKKHRHVLANLKMVCPGKSQAEIESLGRAVWGNIGAVFTEFTLFERLTDPRRNRQYLEVIYAEPEADFLTRSKPCVFVSAHLANWEMIGYTGNRASGGMDVIYNPQPNPWLEKIVQRRRRWLGCGYVGKVNSVRKLLALLKAGKSVGLMVDVRVDGGRLAPFCGADATVTTTPAWLSLQAGCDIVPIQIERLQGVRFRVTFHPALRCVPGEGESRDAAIMRVTEEINQVVEAWVKARPQDWLCTKRRWPKEIMLTRGAYSK